MVGGISPKEVVRMLLGGAFTEWEPLPLPWGSNRSFVIRFDIEGRDPLLAIYKPRSGERPLWDFPQGTLYKREYASYLFCEALGWDFIPPTVIRKGPHGVGSLQLYIPPDPTMDYFALQEKRALDLQKMCLFDVIANNADRKAGHCFQGVDGKVWGIDHGLTFHPFPKLRTVIWNFVGEPIPEILLKDIRRLLKSFQETDGINHLLRPLLTNEEIQAFQIRLGNILETCSYPHPDPKSWNVPWSFY